MPAATRGHTTTLSILNTTIRQDAEGRFCLNDCHRAAGAEKKDGPSYFLATDQAKALLGELRSTDNPVDPLNVVATGPNDKRGTYVVKELVYAYAMWISPAFHLRVIRAFDTMVQGGLPEPVQPPTSGDIVARYRTAVALFRTVIQAGRLAGVGREDAVIAASSVANCHTGVDLLADLRGRFSQSFRSEADDELDLGRADRMLLDMIGECEMWERRMRTLADRGLPLDQAIKEMTYLFRAIKGAKAESRKVEGMRRNFVEKRDGSARYPALTEA